MRKWFILLCTLLLIMFPYSVNAQGTTMLKTLDVRLWSEYDQPSMLVIYDFTVAEDTQLPTTVKIYIPKDGNITAVAFMEGGQLLNADFTGPEDDGNWQVITYFVKTKTTYHLEYYQPLERNGSEKSFTYQWTGDYAVKDFSINVQIPEDSTSAQTKPTLPLVQDQQFLSGGTSISNLSAGQKYQIKLQYSRASDATVLPADSPQVQPAEPISKDTNGRISLDNLPYILGGIGVLLVISAVYYFWRTNSLHTIKPRRRIRSAKEESAETYCHECGARAHAEDRFCRSCGSKLRINF